MEATNRPAMSAKVAACAEQWRAEHPEAGGSPTLSLVDSLKLQIVAAGEAGALLSDLRRLLQMVGREKVDRAISELRADDSVQETREERADAAGRLRSQVVLRIG